MNHNPVNVLLHEHDIIVSLLNKVNDLGKHINNKEYYVEQMNNVLSFLKNYSDGYHHKKEEEILFPALQDHPDFHLSAMIDELNEHHESFREYTRDIEECIGEGNLEKAQTILEKYTSDLSDHIAIENDELFVLAENLFTEDELEKMYFHFQDSDMELGTSEKEEMEKFPDSIS